MSFPPVAISEETTSLALTLAFEEAGDATNAASVAEHLLQLLRANPHVTKLLIHHDDLPFNRVICKRLKTAFENSQVECFINDELYDASDADELEECRAGVVALLGEDEKFKWLILSDSNAVVQGLRAAVEQGQVQSSSSDCWQMIAWALTPSTANLPTHDGLPVFDASEFLAGLRPMSPSIKTLVLSLDYDGCTDTKAARKKLIDCVCALLRERRHITQVKVLIGSARQSLYIDFMNALNHSSKRVPGHEAYQSVRVLGEEFIQALQQAINATLPADNLPVVEFIPLLTGDVYNRLAPGTVFQRLNAMLNRVHGEAIKVAKAEARCVKGQVTFSLTSEPPAQALPRRAGDWNLCFDGTNFLAYVGDAAPITLTEQHSALQACLQDVWTSAEKGPVSFTPAGTKLLRDICLAGYPVQQFTVPTLVENETVSLLQIIGEYYDSAASLAMADEMKVSLSWLQPQHMATRLTEPFAFLLLDDRDYQEDQAANKQYDQPDILVDLLAYYKKNPDVLPDNCHFEAICFDSRTGLDRRTGLEMHRPHSCGSVQGTGAVVANYQAILCEMALALKHSLQATPNQSAEERDQQIKALLRKHVTAYRQQCQSVNALLARVPGETCPPTTSMGNATVTTNHELTSVIATLEQLGVQPAESRASQSNILN